MTAVCPIHNVEMQEKEGQFGIYYSHTIENVGYCNGKKVTPFKGPVAPPRPPVPVDGNTPHSVTKEGPAWSDQEKSRQITRLTITKTFIQNGVDFDNAVANFDLERWVNFVDTGIIPQEIKNLKPAKDTKPTQDQADLYEAFDRDKDKE